MEYVHVVFTLPTEIARIASWTKRAVCGLLFKASADTVTTLAADPRRLGARVGRTGVLHIWGSALTHRPHIHTPHIHTIVPGGGLALDGETRVACRPSVSIPANVMARLSRRLFMAGLMALHRKGDLRVFGDLSCPSDAVAFAKWLAPFRKTNRIVCANRTNRIVCAKPPFGGPKAVLADLSRSTHRAAISNGRLIRADVDTAAVRWNDDRIESGDRRKVMCRATGAFIRRVLIHVLPDGVLARATRKATIAKIRAMIGAAPPSGEPEDAKADPPLTLRQPCPDCGGQMRIIETFRRGQRPANDRGRMNRSDQEGCRQTRPTAACIRNSRAMTSMARRRRTCSRHPDDGRQSERPQPTYRDVRRSKRHRHRPPQTLEPALSHSSPQRPAASPSQVPHRGPPTPLAKPQALRPVSKQH